MMVEQLSPLIPYVLSTKWHPPDTPSLASAVEKAVAAGFREFELGVSEARPSLGDCTNLAERLGLRFAGVHNVFSRRKLDDIYLRGDGIASESKRTRRRAIKLTLETVGIARTLGARYVVLHSGRLPIRRCRSRQFKLSRYLRSLGRTREFGLEVQRQLRKRKLAVEGSLAALRESLGELLDGAGDIVLAIENRYFFHELPFPDELELIFGWFDDQRLVYCHDVGHAAVLDHLGFVPQDAWLNRFRSRCGLCHLHDVRGGHDHLPPGKGTLDFGQVARTLPPRVEKVLEISPRHTIDEVVAGARRLQAECPV